VEWSRWTGRRSSSRFSTVSMLYPDDKVAQTQMNKPQTATASAAPAKPSSPRED
jgi:hypothetical protein